MRKFKLFFDETKEEQWVNDMSQQGWHLKNHRIFFYIFEKGEPGQYVYRCDMLEGFGYSKVAKDYIDFVEGTGAELVYKKLHWVYFRQHRNVGPFELYSDTSSKLMLINRVLMLYIALALIGLLLAIINGGASLYGEVLHLNDFFAGVGTGIFAVMLIPITMLLIRRRNLKKKMALYEV
jgi:hypothetical protein